VAGEGHAVRAHARFGGSTIGRTIACPGWARLAGDTESPPSAYAREGTLAHELAERCLLHGIDPGDMVDRSLQIGGTLVTAEMAEAVAVYVDYVRSRLGPGDILRIEERVSLEPLNPPEPMFGTADAAILSPARRHLEVVDYKHGAGVFVPATTPQLRYYGVGMLFALPSDMPVPETVRLTIVQPRAYSDEGLVRSVELPMHELLDWGWGLTAIVEKALTPDSPLNPGSHCRFCPAAGYCPALRSQAEDQVGAVLFGGEPPPVTSEAEELSGILEKLPLIEHWIAAVRARARDVLNQGSEVPGWKLVTRRGKRVWSDEDRALRILIQEGGAKDKLITTKVVSPAGALKIFDAKARKGLEERLVQQGVLTRTPSDPVLARADDNRPAVEGCGTAAALLFEDSA
jgi:hypothetical protein